MTCGPQVVAQETPSVHTNPQPTIQSGTFQTFIDTVDTVDAPCLCNSVPRAKTEVVAELPQQRHTRIPSSTNQRVPGYMHA